MKLIVQVLLTSILANVALAGETQFKKSLVLWAGSTSGDNPDPQRNYLFTDGQIAAIAQKALPTGSSRKTPYVFAGFHGNRRVQSDLDADAIKLKTANPNLEIYFYISMTLLHGHSFDRYLSDGFIINDVTKNDWLLRATNDGDAFKTGEVLLYQPKDPNPAKNIPRIDISNPNYQNWIVARIERVAKLKLPDANGTRVYSGVFFDTSNKFGYTGYTGPQYQGYQFFSQYLSDAKIAALDASIGTILKKVRDLVPNIKVGFNGFANVSFRENRNAEFYSQADAMLNEEFCAYRSDAMVKDPVTGNEYYKFPDPQFLNSEEILDDLRIARDFPGIQQYYQMNYIDRDGRKDVDRATQNYCFGLYLAAINRNHTRQGAGRYGIIETLEHNPRVTDFGNPVSEPVVLNSSIIYRKYSKGYVASNISASEATLNSPSNLVKVRALSFNGNARFYATGKPITIQPHESVFLANYQTVQLNRINDLDYPCTGPAKITARVVPQKGNNGELQLEALPFSPIDNHWNDTVNRGITNAYRADSETASGRLAQALGTTEMETNTLPFKLMKSILRQRTFEGDTLIEDCHYESP